MSARISALRVDATDPDLLARFWAEALDTELEPGPDDGVTLAPARDGSGLRVRIVPGAGPKVGQNRVHLDLTSRSATEQDDTVTRLLALGGRPADVGQSPEETHVVLADPEGNELCVLAPGNRFLAGAGRLGALNCDGLRATGTFWSDALGWPLVWDQDGETAIRERPGTGFLITWSGPPLIPRSGPNRWALDLAPGPDEAVDALVARLAALGATVGGTDPRDPGAILLTDPDGNELRVVGGAVPG